MASCVLALTCLLATAPPVTAGAVGFRLDPVQALPAQGINVLGVARTDLVPHLSPSGGVLMHYAHDMLVASTSAGTVRVVGTTLTADVWAAFGLFDIVDIGVVAPLILSQTGEPDVGVDANGAGIGDVRLVVRTRFVRPAGASGFGVGGLLQLSLPSGDRDRFHGDGEASAELRLTADWRHRVGVAIAADIGAALRPERRFDDEVVSGPTFRWGLSAQAPLGLGDLISAFIAAQGSVALRDDPAPRRMDPVEMLGGFRFAYDGFAATIAVGGGLTESVGAPAYRILAGLSYRFDIGDDEPEPPDPATAAAASEETT